MFCIGYNSSNNHYESSCLITLSCVDFPVGMVTWQLNCPTANGSEVNSQDINNIISTCKTWLFHLDLNLLFCLVSILNRLKVLGTGSLVSLYQTQMVIATGDNFNNSLYCILLHKFTFSTSFLMVWFLLKSLPSTFWWNYKGCLNLDAYLTPLTVSIS